MSHQKGSRTLYYNDKGMGRFIGGDYAKRHPLALMVGILMSPREDCVPHLMHAISANGVAGELNMLKNNDGKVITEPSEIFKNSAEFDTEHSRPVEMAPEHGTIIISHLFVEFPFPNQTKKSIRNSLKKKLD